MYDTAHNHKKRSLVSSAPELNHMAVVSHPSSTTLSCCGGLGKKKRISSRKLGGALVCIVPLLLPLLMLAPLAGFWWTTLSTSGSSAAPGLESAPSSSSSVVSDLTGALRSQADRQSNVLAAGADSSSELTDRENSVVGSIDVKKKSHIPSASSPLSSSNRLELMDELLKKEGIKPRAWKSWASTRGSGVDLPCFPDDVRRSLNHRKKKQQQQQPLRVLGFFGVDGRDRKKQAKHEQQNDAIPTGFLFVKPAKSGSSTGSTLTLRIATRLAEKRKTKETAALEGGRLNSTKTSTICRCSVEHLLAGNMGIKHRNRQASFLWSVLRDPTRRTVSHYFHFQVSRRNYDPNDDAQFQRHLKKEKNFQDYFLRYLTPDLPPPNTRLRNPAKIINKILDSYDMLGVTERMDESAVALQLLLGLDTSDILFLKSKSSGGYDDGRYHNKCFLIQPSYVSKGMEDYFQNDKSYRSAVYWDELIHHAANRSLDLTIDQTIGHEKFGKALEKFRYYQQRVYESCASSVRYPCSSDGVRRLDNSTDCVYNDWGCGFRCIDETVGRLEMQQRQQRMP